MSKRPFLAILVAVAALILLLLGSGLMGFGPVADALRRLGSGNVVRPPDVPACGWAWRSVPAASASAAYNELHALAAVGPNDVWAAGIYGGEQYALTLIERW